MFYVFIDILIVILLAILGGVTLILTIRAMVDEDFRKSCEKFERERKQGKKNRAGGSPYFDEKDYKMYLKTGNRNYLCKRR